MIFPSLARRWSVLPATLLSVAGLVGCGASSPGDGELPEIDPGTPPARALSFAAPVNFSSGPAPWLLAAGDLNADGRPDLVTANALTAGDLGGLPLPLTQSVSVLLNTTAPGAAAASLAPARHFSTGAGTLGVALGDLNGDGVPDIVATNYGDLGPNPAVPGLSVLLNRTPPGAEEPQFDPPQPFDAGMQPGLVCVEDINGDGRSDLVVGNAGTFDGSAAYSILLNTTPPGSDMLSFEGPTHYDGGGVAEGMVCGDLNGDGLTDVMQGNTQTGEVTILLNQTPRGAAQPDFLGPFRIPANAATAVGLGDFNRDGRPDFVVAEGLSSGGVNVALNQTERSALEPKFSELSHYDSKGSVTEGVAVADFDSDGLDDFAVNNDNAFSFPPTPTGVAVFANRTPAGAAAPEFAEPYTTGPETGANAIVAADLNLDGQPDLVIGNAGTLLGQGAISVLLNTSGQ